MTPDRLLAAPPLPPGDIIAAGALRGLGGFKAAGVFARG